MKWLVVICGFLLFPGILIAQDKKIDQLEVLYDQGHYRKVLRKSKRLLDKPEYDYSGLPAYYKALALFRMAEDHHWYKRHDDCMSEAISAYEKFVQHPSYEQYIYAHYYEMAALKTYLDKLGRQLKELGYHNDAERLFAFSFEQFKSIKAQPDKHEIMNHPELAQTEQNTNSIRERIVVYAKSLIGIKYVWAGSDEKGFDCSGYTAYVLKKYGIQVPRTASGQLEASQEIKISQSQKADLVFFGSGAKITHVGLTVSDRGEELTMIHASTSKGVILTNISRSSYWKPKLKAAGTYIESS